MKRRKFVIYGNTDNRQHPKNPFRCIIPTYVNIVIKSIDGNAATANSITYVTMYGIPIGYIVIKQTMKLL